MIVFSSYRNEILTELFQDKYFLFNFKLETNLRIGFILFHFGSSIGTHSIDIETADKKVKSFGVVVI